MVGSPAVKGVCPLVKGLARVLESAVTSQTPMAVVTFFAPFAENTSRLHILRAEDNLNAVVMEMNRGSDGPDRRAK